MAFFVSRYGDRLRERLSRRARIVIGVVWVVVFGVGGIALGTWILTSMDPAENSSRGLPNGVFGWLGIGAGVLAIFIGTWQTIRIARGRA